MNIPALFVGMDEIMLSTFGTGYVTWTPVETGVPVQVKVIWSDRHVDVAIENGFQVETVSVACTGSAVEFLEAQEGDTVENEGVTYRVTSVRSHAPTMTKLLLRRID